MSADEASVAGGAGPAEITVASLEPAEDPMPPVEPSREPPRELRGSGEAAVESR
jgi:hypothetical protein